MSGHVFTGSNRDVCERSGVWADECVHPGCLGIEPAALGRDVDPATLRTTELLKPRTLESTFRYVLKRIASGDERQPQLAARVALGELPIGALLSTDPEVFCPKCEDQGRRVKGTHNQQLPCNVCGYLPGEHPANVTPMKGASS